MESSDHQHWAPTTNISQHTAHHILLGHHFPPRVCGLFPSLLTSLQGQIKFHHCKDRLNFIFSVRTGISISFQVHPIYALDNAHMPEFQNRENIGFKQSKYCKKKKKVFFKLRQHCKPPTMAMGCFWGLEGPQPPTRCRTQESLAPSRRCQPVLLPTRAGTPPGAQFLGFPPFSPTAYVVPIGKKTQRL